MVEVVHIDSYRTLYEKSSLNMSELVNESVQIVVTSPPY
jgi:DNA modification methylase